LSTFKRYKDNEKSLVRRFVSGSKRGFVAAFAGMARFFRAGRQKLTIMFVPHSEKRILNVQISLFGFFFISAVAVALVGFLAWSAFNYTDVQSKLAGKTNTLQETQENLDLTRDHVSRLINAARTFQAALDSTFASMGLSTGTPQTEGQGGDLASFFDMDQAGSGRTRELSEVDKITAWLEQSVKPLSELETMMSSRGDILTEIPTIWPIKGRLGHISMHYGQNENPIFGSWYMHKGIDISTYRSGDPVVATADGKIVGVSFEMGLGNHIIIEHKYGYITRYAHLKSFAVQKGQSIKQGQVIGYVGNTGLSTGPHLHYEVHLGTDTIDPLRFINSRPDQTAVSGTRN